jgi:hypothetical protein
MSESKPRTSISGKPLTPARRVIAIIGAIAGLLAAATPGFIELLDDTEDDAKRKAEQSTRDAEKSEQKVELAYDLLAQEIKFLREESERQRRDIADMHHFLRDVLLMKLVDIAANKKPANRSRPRPVAIEDLFSDAEMDGLMGMKSEEGEGAAEFDPMPPPQQMQQQLPASLNEAWAKKKGH